MERRGRLWGKRTRSRSKRIQKDREEHGKGGGGLARVTCRGGRDMRGGGMLARHTGTAYVKRRDIVDNLSMRCVMCAMLQYTGGERQSRRAVCLVKVLVFALLDGGGGGGAATYSSIFVNFSTIVGVLGDAREEAKHVEIVCKAVRFVFIQGRF